MWTALSPQLDWEKWEAREPGDPMKTCHPDLHEENNPTGENSEAWKYIAGEFGKMDARETNACKEDMDTLIVVAGLFSAVFATFNVDLYKQLQPSSEGASVYLLAKIAHHLNETSVTAEAVEGFRALSQPSSSATLVNTLWFSGLVLTLMTAAGAMSIKQWLREYNATTVHLPHHYCRLRFFRRQAFTTYKVYEIAASLPCILLCALTFFLIGLACFLWSVNTLVFGAVLFWLLIWLAVYIIAIVLSMMDPACPYTIPMIGNLYKFIYLQILRIRVLVYGRLLGRREYQYMRTMSAASPHSFDYVARTETRHDAMVLVSAFSTFQTRAMNEKVLKAFRTVHLGKIHDISFLKYMFSRPGTIISPQLESHLQPAVKALLAQYFPYMHRLQAIGIHTYLKAVAFVFSSANVGRSRMSNIIGHICALPDEHLSSELVKHILNGVAPCFDFYKKNRWSMHEVSTRVLDVFTKCLSLELSNAPECYNNFSGARVYGDDRPINWIGFYLFLLVHTRRRLDMENLHKSHDILIKFSDLVQRLIDRYKSKFTQDAITQAQLCVELAEEFQDKYSTTVDAALLSGLKYIASIQEPFVIPRSGDVWPKEKSHNDSASSTSLNPTLRQPLQDTPAIDSESVDGKERGNSAQSPASPSPQNPHSLTLSVNKED